MEKKLKTVEMYWLPKCSTCRKAADFLERKGIETKSVRDLKTEKLSKHEVERLAGLAGGPGALFSKRAIKYRSMKLSERNLSDEEMIDLMTDEYTFIRRPVIVAGRRAIAGFSEKRYEAFLNE